MQQLKTRLMILFFVLVCLPSCTGGVRTILIPSGRPVQIRETLRAVPIWVRGASGDRVEGRSDIPAGWWVLPDPGNDEEKQK